MSNWDKIVEGLKEMDKERGWILPLDSALHAELLKARDEGRLAAKLSEPGFEQYRPIPENYYLTTTREPPVVDIYMSMSDPMLRVFHAVLCEALRCFDDRHFTRSPTHATATRLKDGCEVALAARGLPHMSAQHSVYPFVAADATEKPITSDDRFLNYSVLTNTELEVVYSAAALVADFSMLGNGVRDLVMAIYKDAGVAIKNRGLEPNGTLFC